MNYVCVNRGCSKDQTDAICGYYKNSVLLLQFTIWPHLAFEEIVLVHCMKTMNKIMCIYIYMYTHYNYILNFTYGCICALGFLLQCFC